MKRFTKRVEDFTCQNCSFVVTGNGYTNHCPECLWSAHVDIYPGDRSAECGALMEPYFAEVESGEVIITHRCSGCGAIKRNRSAREDNTEILAKLVALQGLGR